MLFVETGIIRKRKKKFFFFDKKIGYIDSFVVDLQSTHTQISLRCSKSKSC